MQRIFYSDDNLGGGSASHGRTGGNDGGSKFPEDSGSGDRRIPDGGGPADGFIDKEGHGTGEGFLGHVKGGEGTRPEEDDDGGGGVKNG